MIIERVWAMPNKWTFTIPPIKKLLSEITDDYSSWVDPFAGMNSPCGLRNDIRENMNATSHMCALEFLKSLPTSGFDGVLYDPPYGTTQSKICYESAGLKNISWSMRWWADIKDEIARVTKTNGKVVCFGWSSNGIGMSRGFEMNRVLLVPHGGSKNDTIITVETKISESKTAQVSLDKYKIKIYRGYEYDEKSRYWALTSNEAGLDNGRP